MVNGVHHLKHGHWPIPATAFSLVVTERGMPSTKDTKEQPKWLLRHCADLTARYSKMAWCVSVGKFARSPRPVLVRGGDD